MLVDVRFHRLDDGIAFALNFIANGDVMPRRIGNGLYESGHWSVDRMCPPVRNRFEEDPYSPPPWEEYGVCDHPQQVVDKYNLAECPERVFVAFVKIDKASQPRTDGWRWHKWGEYIGTKAPQNEYIADEGDDIQSVYTFHIYELAE